MIYNVVSISAVQQSHSVIHTHMHTHTHIHTFFFILFHLDQEPICYLLKPIPVMELVIRLHLPTYSWIVIGKILQLVIGEILQQKEFDRLFEFTDAGVWLVEGR